MKLSIIIPVYKVEKYLRKCLESCLKQNVSASEYEIICINDGSPDKCDEILQEYKSQYQNLKVITQDNQGLSMARNNGLKIAKGEYIWFVDSDDWIEKNCLRNLINELDGNIDFIQVPLYYVYEASGVIKEGRKPYWDGILSSTDAYLKGYLYMGAQYAVVRRNLFREENIEFMPGILHEDVEYKPRLYVKDKKCKCFKQPIYYYLLRKSGSITANFSIRNANGYIEASKSLINFAKINKLRDSDLVLIGTVIGEAMSMVFKNFRHLSTQEKQIVIKYLNGSEIFKYMHYSKNRKHRICSTLIKINPSIAIGLISKISQP